MLVYGTRTFDPVLQKLVDTAPYIDTGAVYTVTVVNKTQAELGADAAAAAAKVQQDAVDTAAAKTYAKLKALAGIDHSAN